MVDTVLALGEGDTYWFESGTQYKYKCLPDILRVVDGTFASMNHVAFGPGGSFVVSFKKKGESNSRIASMRIPQELETWLYTEDEAGRIKRNYGKLRVSFGDSPGRFWATDGATYRWHNLPQDLQVFISSLLKDGKFKETPLLVLLGMGDDYIIRTDERWKWQLANYPSVAETLSDFAKTNGLHILLNLTINPFKKNCGVFYGKGGGFESEGLPASMAAEVEQFAACLKTETKEAEAKETADRIAQNQRSINLLQMATAQADASAAFNRRQADVYNGIHRVCARCRHSYCTCPRYY